MADFFYNTIGLQERPCFRSESFAGASFVCPVFIWEALVRAYHVAGVFGFVVFGKCFEYSAC